MKINNSLTIRGIILLCILLGFTNYAVAGNRYNSITYNLSLKNIKESVLKVEVILKGKFKDKVMLDLPSKWASASYTEQITNIQVASAYKLIRNGNELQAIVTIPNNLGDQIKISYEIHQKPNNSSDVHEAIIRDNLVHSPGYGIFALPHDLNEADKVIINWLDIDQDWETISSYGIGSSFNLRNIMATELLHAIYVAGKIRVYQIGNDSQPVFLSLYGNLDVKDHNLIYL